jgi:hypothetical protein
MRKNPETIKNGKICRDETTYLQLLIFAKNDFSHDRGVTGVGIS